MTTSGRAGDRGVSLAALLVGIVIVGLVATVIVIGLRAPDPKPSRAECDADQSALLRAEQRYYSEHGDYATEEELVAAGLLEEPLPLQDVTLAEDSFKPVPTAVCTQVVTGATTPVAAHLALNFVPDTVTAGRLIDPAITVTLTGDDGAVLTDSTADVTISLTADNGAKLSGTTTVRAVAGVATFAGLAIDKAGSGYTFAAEASGATVTSASTVTVNPGSPARLRFVSAPPSATPGVLFPAQPVVDVEDVMGNVIE
ncbi:MAG TPA: hypothetical protein VH761_04750, partial [Ilumatobacteraceae bacterium]